MQPLKEGERAPDFSLPSTPDQRLSLHELRGRSVVLIFYPADWSPVCSDELSLFSELQPEFKDLGVQLVAVSCDGVWSHLAFAKDRSLRIPLLSDFEPKGAVSRVYGVYDEKTGESQRALILIDKDGVVRWSYVSPVGLNPGADGVIKALESLAKREPEAVH